MPRRPPRSPLGEFIRNQRDITRLSLRQLANLARISNPYLSQIERGLHEPSAAILKSIAAALGIPPEKLYAAAGWLSRMCAGTLRRSQTIPSQDIIFSV